MSSTNSLPSTQYAIQIHTDGAHPLKDHPVPTPGPTDLLVQNIVIASNPKDWKLHDDTFMAGKKTTAAVEGNDIAGVVVGVGKEVTRFQVGDQVSGMTPMMAADAYGAYQQYTLLPQHSAFKIPDGVTEEQAVTFALPGLTAVTGLFKELKLNDPILHGIAEANSKGTLLVYGGSTSVGVWVIQLAKLAGYRVITVAGAGCGVAKEFRADVVIDYRNKSQDELVKEILSHVSSSKKIQSAYDCVAEGETFDICARVLHESNGGGDLCAVLPAPSTDYQSKLDYFKKVKILRTGLHQVHGNVWVPNPDTVHYRGPYADYAARALDDVARWFAAGYLRAHRTQKMPNGLDSVGEGLQLLKDKKVSAARLVYYVNDTPALNK